LPQLVHSCGKRVKFPPGTEGKRGKCPHCGGAVEVPAQDTGPPKAMHLDPPPHWAEYEAYLDDRGPPPRPMVMPSRLMLQTEAEARWERRSEVRYSKYRCPSCRERMLIDTVVCTECGLDYRTGKVLGKSVKLNEKGMRYLETVPWLRDAKKAPPAPEPAPEPPLKGSGKFKAPRKSGSGSTKAPKRRRRLR